MAIWQAFEAAIGESGPQDKTAIAERVLSGVRAILYLLPGLVRASRWSSGANASMAQTARRTSRPA